MTFHAISCLISIILTLLILYSLVVYLIDGWRRKADDIILSLSPTYVKAYFEAFQRKTVDEETSIAKFTQFYNRRYGQKYLIFPILLVFLSTVIISYSLSDTLFLVLQIYNRSIAQTNEYINLPLVATAALAGAYGFVVWEFIWRSARRDLSPANILGGAVRMWIAVPLGYSLAALKRT